MAQQFEHSLDDGPLRAQRMTADEARAVIALWQSERVEQTGLTDKPAVPDVAEGLDISAEDVRRLLMEVRAKRLEEERALAAEQEFSEIRLAEEERRHAEIQRQRAEQRRQRAEQRRQQAEQQRGQRVGAWSRQTASPPERHGNQAKKEPKKLSKPGYFYAVLVFSFILLLVLHKPDVPQISPATDAVTISHESATYNAQGQIQALIVTCADSTGRAIACGEDTTATEKRYLQDQHDQGVADAQTAAAKKNHDK